MTPEQLQQATGCRIIVAARYAQPLTVAMAKHGIVSRNQRASFIANCAHESGLFTATEEGLFYSSAERLASIFPRAFANAEAAKPFTGNPAALAKKLYDGYQGRGLIQLTWLKNYQAYAKASGVDVVAKPQLLTEAPYAADSAAWFWATNGCNELADQADWRGVTRAINGKAMLGHDERVKLTERALKVFI